MQDQEPSEQETQEPQVEEAQDQEAPQAEQPPESADPEAEQSPEDSEGADEGGDKEAAGEKQPEGKHKRKTGYQRSIERLERQVAERDAMLAQALARLPQQQGAPGAAEPPPEQKAAEQFSRMVEDVVGRAFAQRQQQEQAAKLEEKWAAQMPEDEDEAYEVRKMLGQVQGIRHGPVKEALLTSEFAPRIISELLRNPQELARVTALPEIAQTREILRLEAKVSAAGAAPVKPTSAARPPPPPSKVSGGVSPSTRRLEDLPLAEYKKAMRSGRR